MLDENALRSFIESVRRRNLAIVEDGEAALSQAGHNVGEFVRQVPCILRVTKKADLPIIVEEANRWRVQVYPYSKGMNWGYGSRLSTRSGSVLLDLSHLNRIININEVHGIATIEPGVTQRQLADELLKRGSHYYLDVTGSGSETSILGNALERGIAYGSLRVQQVTGMEILLGNGKQFHTGFGSSPHPVLAGLYSYGLGPALDGLFFQSNLGIVLEGHIQLTLRPERLVGLTIALKDKNISAFMDQARDLLQQGYIHGIPHLANRERTISTIAPLLAKKTGLSKVDARNQAERVIHGDWILTTAVAGSPAIVNEKIKHIKKVLGPLGRVYSHVLTRPLWKDRLKSWCIDRILSREQRVLIQATEPLRGFHKGKPSDAGIQFLLQGPNASVDENPEGFLLCTPLAPLSGESALAFAQMAKEISAKHQVRFAMTLNILTSRTLEAVISVHFSRSYAEEKSRAHACVDEMTNAFADQGFYPYRVNIDQQQRFASLSPVLADVIRSIKRVLDPSGIIAPGRYQ